MPDDDKLPRSLSARWRRVLKAFQAGESQEAIEHHVAKAAAETLRRTHGVPELPALGAQMYLDATTGYGADGSSRRALSAHIPTRLARQAVDALSAVMKERRRIPQRCCWPAAWSPRSSMRSGWTGWLLSLWAMASIL